MFAEDRFAPPDINAGHQEINNTINSTDKIVNSDYIISHVTGRVKKKIRDATEDDDVIIINKDSQDDGDHSINTVELQPGAEVKGDIFIIDTGGGDRTIIETNK